MSEPLNLTPEQRRMVIMHNRRWREVWDSRKAQGEQAAEILDRLRVQSVTKPDPAVSQENRGPDASAS